MTNTAFFFPFYYSVRLLFCFFASVLLAVRADCSIAEADPHHPREGGLTHFGKVIINTFLLKSPFWFFGFLMATRELDGPGPSALGWNHNRAQTPRGKRNKQGAGVDVVVV